MSEPVQSQATPSEPKESSLAELQRAFSRICLVAEPSESDLALLHGDPQRWRMYRHMVRHRLAEMARNGLPKTVALLGQDRFDRDFESFLAERGSRSRFLRDVVSELVSHAIDGWASDASLPAHTIDLARYEQAKWQVASVPWEPREPAAFDFERRALINPTVRVVVVAHRVDRDPVAAARLEGPSHLIVYRKPGDPRIYTWALNDIGGKLFAAWAAGSTCKDAVTSVLAAEGRQADTAFVDGMAGVLADLIEQTIVLGSA